MNSSIVIKFYCTIDSVMWFLLYCEYTTASYNKENNLSEYSSALFYKACYINTIICWINFESLNKWYEN